jgi:diacylglycerol kinase family enzyme
MTARGAITVIVNARSGNRSNLDATDRLREAFEARGASVRIVPVPNPLDIAVRAKEAATRGDIVVAAGGDGTVSAVAAAAVEAGATMGVLPMGTLNHFAKDLGLPLDREQAIAAIAEGRFRDVDVAEVNGRIFVNNSSVGIYPRMLWEREAEQQRGRPKWVAFAIAVMRTWRRYRMVVARLVVDGKETIVRTPFVFIGNNEYKAEGFDLGGRTTMDDGRLSIFLAPECGRFEFLSLPVRALTRRLGGGAPFVGFSVDTLAIDVPRPRVSVAIDGEVAMMRSPLRYRIRPRALRVVVPAGTRT